MSHSIPRRLSERKSHVLNGTHTSFEFLKLKKSRKHTKKKEDEILLYKKKKLSLTDDRVENES